MKCAHCKKSHETVAQVRECAQAPAEFRETETPDGLRLNRYAGKCKTCAGRVEEQEGHIEKVNDKWAVFHNSGDCSPKFDDPAIDGPSEPKPYPDVPAGHYAIKSLTGANDIDFFRVNRPMEGTWAGATFVRRIVGGHPDSRVRGKTVRLALQAILDAGPEKAMALYGQELGQCGKCNRSLTDEVSRALGIGPVCRTS